MTVIRIDDLEDSRLDDYRNVSDGELIRRRGLFVAEGRLLVQRLLRAGFRVTSLLVSDTGLRSLEDDLRGLSSDVAVYVCALNELADIVGFNHHRGCLALAERPPDRDLVDVVQSARLLLVLEGVTDPDNVGSAFRNASAFGVDGVVLNSCCDPLYRKAIRTSMGGVLQMPYARVKNWPHIRERLKDAAFTVVALTPDEQAVEISAFAARHPKPEKIALVVGGEASGLAAETLADADARVCIPMAPGVDSLNLATAAGIALYCLVAPDRDRSGPRMT